MTMLLLTLPAGHASTAKIRTQPRLGGSWSASIDPNLVNGRVYSFTVPSGDQLVQLTGVSESDGDPFNVREGIAYFNQTWEQIDATIANPPIIANPTVANVCRVQLRARRGAVTVQARVLITCGASGRLVDSAFANVAYDGLTDVNGLLLVDLPWSSIAGVGKYRFKLIDSESGDVFHDRTVTVPDQLTAVYEGLQ